MAQRVRVREQRRQITARLRMIEHYQQVSRNICQTCRFFGISRSQFYVWLRRYRETGRAGLCDRPRGPRVSPSRIPPDIEALILRIRRERHYGAVRLSLFLKRYHQVYVLPPTILRVFRDHKVPRLPLKRHRPTVPQRRRHVSSPGQSVQVDVKHLKRAGSISSRPLMKPRAFAS